MFRIHNPNEIEMLALLLEGKLELAARKEVLSRIAEDNDTAMAFTLSQILRKKSFVLKKIYNDFMEG